MTGPGTEAPPRGERHRRRLRRTLGAVASLAVVMACVVASRPEDAPPPPARRGAAIIQGPAASPKRAAVRHQAAPTDGYLVPRPYRDPAVQGQDRETPAALRRARARMRRAPAFQRLPFRGDGVLIELGAGCLWGRMVVNVAYTGTRAQAVAAWRFFLSANRDPGTAYVPRFIRWDRYVTELCPDPEACRVPRLER